MAYIIGKYKSRDFALLNWKNNSPAKFWGSVFGVVLLLGGFGFLVYARNATVSRDLTYQQCEASYGQSLAAWDGVVEQSWNERNFHYETRRFLVRSKAPRTVWANILETPPTRITTGSPDGSTEPCLPEFDNLVDTTKGDYLWQGARPVAARLGVPDLEDVNNQGRTDIPNVNTRLAEQYSPPLYEKDYQKAAAWVDDGGQTVIKPQGGKAKLLWCFNHAEPLGTAQKCGEITGTQKAGAGYLFVEDNCPLNRDVDCTQAGQWYQKPAAAGSVELTEHIGQNKRGELVPFNLYLDAVSTYGYQVGTWTSITFKYSKITDVSNSLSLNRKTVEPGAKLRVNVSLAKTGPDLKSLELVAEYSDQPVELLAGFELKPRQLALLNKGQAVEAAAEFRINKNAGRGKCYSLGVNFSAAGTVEVEGSDHVAIPALSGRYCIAQPQAAATYTYDVSSRGDIQSSLNEFITLSAETLAHKLGWRSGGAAFKRIEAGGDFSLVLSSPDQMTSFSPGCDSFYSCRAGRYVIINDERWRKATPAWSNGGGSLRDYRHMVINHEVGHFLGFGHLNCPAQGAKAPVMQQQSISLQGCQFNTWPTRAEVDTLKSRL